MFDKDFTVDNDPTVAEGKTLTKYLLCIIYYWTPPNIGAPPRFITSLMVLPDFNAYSRLYLSTRLIKFRVTVSASI